jgi:prepilin-type processing-associated H-X9-DG protein
MNLNSPKTSTHEAFSLIELIIVIVVLVGLGLVVVGTLGRSHSTSSQVGCTGRLEENGAALSRFASEHSGNFPMIVPTNEGGTKEFIGAGNITDHFRTLSKYISLRCVTCPLDCRTEATDWPNLSSSNLSYFVSIQPNPHDDNIPTMGDRVITSRTPGKAELNALSDTLWTTSPGHSNSGNLLFPDGHVRSYGRITIKVLASCTNLQIVVP